MVVSEDHPLARVKGWSFFICVGEKVNKIEIVLN